MNASEKCQQALQCFRKTWLTAAAGDLQQLRQTSLMHPRQRYAVTKQGLLRKAPMLMIIVARLLSQACMCLQATELFVNPFDIAGVSPLAWRELQVRVRAAHGNAQYKSMSGAFLHGRRTDARLLYADQRRGHAKDEWLEAGDNCQLMQ